MLIDDVYIAITIIVVLTEGNVCISTRFCINYIVTDYTHLLILMTCFEKVEPGTVPRITTCMM